MEIQIRSTSTGLRKIWYLDITIKKYFDCKKRFSDHMSFAKQRQQLIN